MSTESPTATQRLEALEQKCGRRYTMRDFNAALLRADASPAALTDVDLVVLEFFGGSTLHARHLSARQQAENVVADQARAARVRLDETVRANARQTAAAITPTRSTHDDDEIDVVHDVRPHDDEGEIQETTPVVASSYDHLRFETIVRRAYRDPRSVSPEDLAYLDTEDPVLATVLRAGRDARTAIATHETEAKLQTDRSTRRLHRPSTLQKSDILFIVKWFAKFPMPVITDFVRKSLAKRDARLEILEERHAALEDRLRALESEPREKYLGVWQEGCSYPAGSNVTHHGSGWYAKESTSAKPGGSDPASRAWILRVKRGADGKDHQR